MNTGYRTFLAGYSVIKKEDRIAGEMCSWVIAGLSSRVSDLGTAI